MKNLTRTVGLVMTVAGRQTFIHKPQHQISWETVEAILYDQRFVNT